VTRYSRILLALLILVTPARFALAEACLDYDGDGWGYNSQGSCEANVEGQSVLDCTVYDARSFSDNADFVVASSRAPNNSGLIRGFDQFVVNMNNGNSLKVPVVEEPNLISKSVNRVVISADGRRVLYTAYGQWQALDANGDPREGVTYYVDQIFLFDTETGDSTPVELRGGYLNGDSVQLSGDGNIVTYNTSAEISAAAHYINMQTGEVVPLVSNLSFENEYSTRDRIVAVSNNGRFALFFSGRYDNA